MSLTVIRLVLALIVLSASIWVYVDAKSLGAERGVLGGGLLDMGAGAWLACCLLFWIISLPAYLINRYRLVAARNARFQAGLAPRTHLALTPAVAAYPPPPGYAAPFGYPAPFAGAPMAYPAGHPMPAQAYVAYPPPPRPYAAFPPQPYAPFPPAPVAPPAAAPSGPSIPAAASPEVAAELDLLRQQHQAGEISIVEFMARKKRLE